ncbi:bacillithiol system redox-active protein YtxJ [Niallia taxi]|uniref:bacillithiol system redox-active protein YtxJ n=1 Tax=Niallia taxi TaxID=2499688 RepID=UPI0015F41466|nr:bacillithiol system redox-active protein YtxJ [Niallia taxi]
MKKIETVEHFEEILSNNKTAFIVKHSLTCPISAAAFDEYKQYADSNSEVDTYYLAVQDARPLSNYIAETFNIRHESPQALLFSDRSVVWNASHGGITVNSLKEASIKA